MACLQDVKQQGPAGPGGTAAEDALPPPPPGSPGRAPAAPAPGAGSCCLWLNGVSPPQGWQGGERRSRVEEEARRRVQEQERELEQHIHTTFDQFGYPLKVGRGGGRPGWQ